MTIKRIFQVRNGAILQLWDNSHLDFVRNGCRKSLRQNQESYIKTELDELNAVNEVEV
ncbi:hypothetical protein [Sediminibacter sp. Hel_I_10]|uniref:hypothetical protein n=1 Tax=Sediminibacter sp. Hel_I_10 TaxID=1392490 RepID=UPI0012DE0724|nr:hypothetical protein [Sediminibacter sp. Hel_I_10]